MIFVAALRQALVQRLAAWPVQRLPLAAGQRHAAESQPEAPEKVAPVHTEVEVVTVHERGLPKFIQCYKSFIPLLTV